MDFGLMFFSSDQSGKGGHRYRLLLEASRFADDRGFCAIWTPERHFHNFGGLFPNPAVTSAALAVATERLQIRAGSLISPLHDSIRIAEEWAMVDNLSHGRVAISFGSGWNINDFIFFPERYASRQAFMHEQIREVQAIWKQGVAKRSDGRGEPVEVAVYPRPIQEELPVWITSSGNVETFVSAGRLGANLLTHLIGQDLPTLAAKIERYRAARREAGHDPAAGRVALMLHTFLGNDVDAVRQIVREPFRRYIASAIRLEEKAASGGGVMSGGRVMDPSGVPGEVFDELLDLTFERYFHTAALMGTPASCRPFVGEVAGAGVDEVACLIDFLDDEEAILGSLELVDVLRAACAAPALRTRA
jgi:natural product biosynthesis luciferase-like monooxygenase protein